MAYLRDRLTIAKELLADEGSIFLQISDENVHRVRMLMDEVFGSENAVVTIVLKKKGATTPTNPVNDYILWYAKNLSVVKVKGLFEKRVAPEDDPKFNTLIGPNGEHIRATQISEQEWDSLVRSGYTPARVNYPLVSQDYDVERSQAFTWRNKTFDCGVNRHWTYDPKVDMHRLAKAQRIFDGGGKSVGGIRLWSDWPLVSLSNLWNDLHGDQEPIYVVQTNRKAIQRCMLMTTDPGDLVLDPTCGSGTTAYIAEQYGRRWITIDTSRVALALTKQRLLTSKFDYYELVDVRQGISSNFVYETEPNISLKSIAQNQALDHVFDKWEPILAEKLGTLNAALARVTYDIRTELQRKLVEKERREGKRAISEAGRRRWLLPQEKWEEWEVPFDADPDWPQPLQAALEDYRQAWRQKMDEVNETIAASAPQEVLVDRPKVVKNVLRVSGPFTVEGVQPVEQPPDGDSPIGGAPQGLETFGNAVADDPVNAEAYLEKMVHLLRQDGVRFPDNKVVKFERLEPLFSQALHAEGEWTLGGETRLAAVAFGPQYGPITAQQVEACLWAASRRGYDDLVLAGFTIDGAAQATIQEDPNPRVRCHLAHVRPDVNMGDLLKDTPSSQLFTVFGEPRVRLEETESGEFVVTMEGVDIYDPVNNTIHATKADKVAAWFLDADYDGQSFCISQAFFPDKSAWDRLARALKTLVDPQRFAAFSGTQSLPFPAGGHQRAAVKVIDPRGNEVMRVLRLGGEVRYTL